MSDETRRRLEAALDAHRAAMPQVPTPEDHRLWDAVQAVLAALPAAPPPDLVARAEVLRVFDKWRKLIPPSRGFTHPEGLDFTNRINALAYPTAEDTETP